MCLGSKKPAKKPCDFQDVISVTDAVYMQGALWHSAGSVFRFVQKVFQSVVT